MSLTPGAGVFAPLPSAGGASGGAGDAAGFDAAWRARARDPAGAGAGAGAGGCTCEPAAGGAAPRALRVDANAHANYTTRVDRPAAPAPHDVDDESKY